MVFLSLRDLKAVYICMNISEREKTPLYIDTNLPCMEEQKTQINQWGLIELVVGREADTML